MIASTAVTGVLTAESMGDEVSADVTLAPNVAIVEAWDGSSRLLDFGGDFLGLTPVSTAMLVNTLRCGRDEAVRRIAEQFVVAEPRVRADLDQFIGELTSRRILVRRGRNETRPSIWFRCGRGVAAWLLRRGQRTSGRCRLAFLLALVQFQLWLCGWATTVAMWRAASAGSTGDASQDVATLVQHLRSVSAGHLLPVDCKARSLCLWGVLRAVGTPATLVVGVDLFPFLGHCWCELYGQAVGQDGPSSARFVPVMRYI